MEIEIAPGQNLLVVVPEAVVLVTALLVMLLDLVPRRVAAGRKVGPERREVPWLTLGGLATAAGVSYYIWDATVPVLQGMLAADGFALFLNLAILAVAALATLFSIEYVQRTDLPSAEYYTLLLLATAGMMLLAAAVHLVTLFLALEILGVALYALVGLNRHARKSAEAALKYVLLGAFASATLLYGMALVYGLTGTLSLTGIRDAVRVGAVREVPLLLVGLGLIVAGLGFKVALVPFHMWLPDVYEGAPTSVTAFMSAGVKIAAFAALGRVLVSAFGGLVGSWQGILAVFAAVTMSVGNLAALRQGNLKRMLAYSSIAHAGYVLVGLATRNEAGIAGLLFYLFTYGVTIVAAFGVIIAAGRLDGVKDGGETVESLVGLGSRSPWLAAALTLCLLSLTGLPPLVGFMGKLYIFGAAVQAGLTWLAVVGVINSVVSAGYYLQVASALYRGKTEASRQKEAVCPALLVGLGLAAAAIVGLGLWPAPILDLARATVAALLGG